MDGVGCFAHGIQKLFSKSMFLFLIILGGFSKFDLRHT